MIAFCQAKHNKKTILVIFNKGILQEYCFLLKKTFDFCAKTCYYCLQYEKAVTKTVGKPGAKRVSGWCKLMEWCHKTHHFRAEVPSICQVLSFARVKG